LGISTVLLSGRLVIGEVALRRSKHQVSKKRATTCFRMRATQTARHAAARAGPGPAHLQRSHFRMAARSYVNWSTVKTCMQRSRDVRASGARPTRARLSTLPRRTAALPCEQEEQSEARAPHRPPGLA
jgi:hypothetical protein